MTHALKRALLIGVFVLAGCHGLSGGEGEEATWTEVRDLGPLDFTVQSALLPFAAEDAGLEYRVVRYEALHGTVEFFADRGVPEGGSWTTERCRVSGVLAEADRQRVEDRLRGLHRCLFKIHGRRLCTLLTWMYDYRVAGAETTLRFFTECDEGVSFCAPEELGRIGREFLAHFPRSTTPVCERTATPL